MKPNTGRDSDPQNGPVPSTRWAWLFIAAAVIILIGLFHSTKRGLKVPDTDSPDATGAVRHSESPAVNRAGATRPLPQRSHPSQPPTAEEIVAAKVVEFGRSRREIARAIGRRLQKEVPTEVERFFDAVESGRWEDIDAQWKELAKHTGQYENSTNHWPELDPFWSAVLDAYGAAEQAHNWPPQELLDYGKSILDSLRPGMVYVGGTDNGRWIPELVNGNGDDEHIIVTQNGMADARYLEWMNTLYGDRMKTLTPEDSQRAFQDYIADATRRFQHDQQFPDEPKQIRPGEDIKFVDGKVQVSGQVAVMGINERLLQMLMEKNPDLSFGLQESFPLTGTYGEALPLGPIMELNAKEKNAFTSSRAAESLDVWRSRANQISSADSPVSTSARLSYSHDATATANLLAAHQFPNEAEQVYRLASQMSPENPEPVAGLSRLLTSQGRGDEATRLLTDFSRKYPGQLKELERSRGNFTVTAEMNSH
jgi:Tetratricopeptide repeat